MAYKRQFDPGHVEVFADPDATTDGHPRRAGDRAGESVYVYADPIVLAVNVALATDRPLLIRGASGSGKSSLARNVAAKLGWRYHEAVVTSRTQARDLEWTFDAVRRLSDAAEGEVKPTQAYIQPGVLWWAFDAAGARAQAGAAGVAAANPSGDDPALDAMPAVVLIDEIDKADPDVPNDLLVPVGSMTFTVADTGQPVTSVAYDKPLLCITTNEERDLPPAFLRRCVGLRLPDPDENRLIQIARAHFPDADTRRARTIAKQFVLSDAGDLQPTRTRASTAEYLDAIQASLELEVNPSPKNKTWQSILNAIVSKAADPTPRP